ncbi:MAG: restriction endonuclease subunit S [Verrucomicrobiae bacterium]|nr:restriction endonuclease subunit S [Verrucomicrobiae bacterium]
MLKLESKNGNEPRFIFSQINTPRYTDYVSQIKRGNANQANITVKDLMAYRIAVSSLPEQRKIADFLTAVDGRIGQLIQKRALLEDYKKGVMQQLFTQAIRFQDDHGNDFPDWEEKKLGEVVEVNPKSTDLPESFIYIDLESVNDGRLHSPRRIAKSDAPSRAQRLLQKGDILYQTVRPYQMNNYRFDLDDVHVASTGYAQLRASSHNAEFVYQSVHFPTFVGAVLDRCTGTSYPAINSKDLAEIKLGVPSIGEQTKIANFLSAIDRKIESVATQVTDTQTFKRGLLQQMFV